MTDFDARAREMVEADDWPDVQCTVGGAHAAAMIIAAALKAAYNEGLEDVAQEDDAKAETLHAAANDGRCNFDLGHAKAMAYAQSARAARAKKVPV